MKKILKMENLECAHCAAKMEKAVSKINGVQSVAISFMTQKMVLECNEEAFEAILPEIKRVCASVEPNCLLK